MRSVPLLLLSTACCAALRAHAQPSAPALVGRTVVVGTVLGADGRPLARAFAQLRGAEQAGRDRAPLATVRVGDDGRFALATSGAGPFSLELRAVGYRRETVPIVFDSPQTVGLDVRLRRTAALARVDSVRVVGEFNHWERKTAVPLSRQPDGTWVGEVAAVEGADTVAYQVLGVAAEPTANPGATTDRAILDLEGFGFWGAASVAPAPSGRARIVVDPARVAADTTSGSVTFRDGAAPVARYAALVREYREEDERLAERAAALRKAGQAVPGALYDRPARLARVAARLDAERDPALRARLAQRVFWLSLDDSLPIAPTLLRTAAALDARSPAWGALPDEYGTALIQLAVRAGPPPARADQFPLMDSAVARRALAVADSVLAQPGVPSGVREGVSALGVHAANFARLRDSAGVRYRQFARDYPWSWELRALRTQFDASRTVAAGRPVPAFRFVALGDSARTITNAALSGHKLTLVDFWAVWCGPCVGEMPNIARAYAKYRTRGLQVLSVSLDDRRASVAAFRRDKHAMPWLHAWAPRGFADPAVRPFEITFIPRGVLVDEHGVVVAADADMRGERLQATLARILGP